MICIKYLRRLLGGSPTQALLAVINLSQIDPMELLFFFGGQSSSRSIRQRPSQGHRMDLRGSYERKTGRVEGPLHHENFEILAKIRFEDMNLQSKARGISWAERGSHRIEKMMVYDRKTEFIKMFKKSKHRIFSS